MTPIDWTQPIHLRASKARFMGTLAGGNPMPFVTAVVMPELNPLMEIPPGWVVPPGAEALVAVDAYGRMLNDKMEWSLPIIENGEP